MILKNAKNRSKCGFFVAFFLFLQGNNLKKHNHMQLLTIGWAEILLIALIILLLFGAKKIPELMKGLGKGVKSFKEGMNEVDEDLKNLNDKKKQEKKAEE